MTEWEEIYDQYYDTIGNFHYTGIFSGHHVINMGLTDNHASAYSPPIEKKQYWENRLEMVE